MIEKKTPQQAAFHESASYIYTKVYNLVYVDLRAKLPEDKKGDTYSCSVTGDEQIFDRYKVTQNGDLYIRVNSFTRQEHDRKNGCDPCNDRNGKL